MRKLSKQGKSFSFTFMSYSISRGTTDGIIEVQSARLRKRGSSDFNQYAELQEEYVNTKNGEPRRFWHCCLLSLNGQSLKFSTE
ncbi:hypothetical protein [Sphingobacterium hotanense]|uniref:hypothetical protein n=1 Tax=Sphingobacterium hotanense TaxID=649196 RepID=UPI0011F381EC|nr:hypothetical protein [Sphingobacterium hotanense]